jgi:acyl-CoA synthetase (AMP-forming)/AMP-acid ligase II
MLDEAWLQGLAGYSSDTISEDTIIEFLSRDFVKFRFKDYVYITEVPKTSVSKFDKKRD